MIHAPDWQAALEWYLQIFPAATRIALPQYDFECLTLAGIRIECVVADEKVANGAAGTVVYWAVENFDAEWQRMIGLGAQAFRGPMTIENGQKMGQLKDPWGNPFGLRDLAHPSVNTLS